MDLLDPAHPQAAAVRVAAVTGLAGVGKTELVLQAAHAALGNGWFPGGVLFVDVLGYDPQRAVMASTVLEGLLHAAGIPGESIPAEEQDRSRLLSSVLAAYAAEGRPVLVVVDNVASSTHARPLIPAVGKVIITSRHVLADLHARLVELDSITPDAGAELLAGYVGLARGASDMRVADYPADALLIARLCAGLPLALRIMAALLAAHPARSLASMVADLRDARTRLDEIRYTGADSEIAVRSAFDLSYRQLNPQQRRTFRLLALNPGPQISTEAAAALTLVEQRTARHQLDELARAHLIETVSTYGMWRMHDLIRLYAAQQLEADGDDWTEPLTQLLLYYLNTANDATEHLNPASTRLAGNRFADRASALAWLDAEYPNLTAIARHYPPSDMIISLSHNLWRYFELRRYFDDWISLTTRALTMARQLQDRPGEARALSSLGGALRQVRRFDEAIAACQDAVAIYRQEGDRHGEGIALNNLAAAQAMAGQFEEAITTYQDVAAAFGQTGDRYRHGIALNTLGAAFAGGKRYEDARATYQEAATIFHERGDRRGEAGALSNLANVLSELGRLDEAIAVSKDAINAFRESGARHGEASALNNLGAVLLRAKRYEEADAPLREAAAAFHETADWHGEAAASSNHGRALRKLGRFQEAIDALRNGAAAYRETGDRHAEGDTIKDLGETLALAGKREEAVTAFRQAVQILRDTGDREGQGQALASLGAFAGVGRADEAIAACQDAADIFRQTGDRLREDKALKALRTMTTLKREWDTATTLINAGRVEEAVAAFQGIPLLLHLAGDQYGEAAALASLGTALHGAGRLSEAIGTFQEAAQIFHDTNHQPDEAAARASLQAARQAQLAQNQHRDSAQ